MVTATITIGSMRLTMEAQNMKDIFKWSGVYSILPKKCDSCQSPNLHLSHKSPKGNDYFSLKCADCGAEGNFGQTKDGGNLYYKYDTKMEVYRANQ